MPDAFSPSVVAGAQAAVRTLAATSSEHVSRIATNLGELDPGASGFLAPEVDHLAQSLGLESAQVAELLSLVFLIGQAPRSGVGFDDLVTLVAKDVAPEAASRVLKALGPHAAKLAHRFDVMNEVEEAMPTFRDVIIASDLRLVARGESLDMVPVTIVRLVLDEGEPITFQCLPKGMRRLLEVLEVASGRMEDLRRMAHKDE